MTRRIALALVILIATLCSTAFTTVDAAGVAEVDVNRVCFFTLDDDYRCSTFRTDGTWLRDETAGDVALLHAQMVPSAMTSGQRRFLEMHTATMPGETAVPLAGTTGCDDEMLCPWLYA